MVKMKLLRPVVILDLETTGTWIEKDRIIEIAFIRCAPSTEEKVYHRRVNPGMPIPPKISEITGIRDEDVRDQPRFPEIPAEALAFVKDADFGGFNIERFDLPMLEREMHDAGLKFEWKTRMLFDAQKVYHLKEKRDLTAAYSFYCGKELACAHSAMGDARATLEILDSQVARYGNGDPSIETLKGYDYQRRHDFYDEEGKFCWWNGELYPMFGKYARRRSLRELAKKEPKYLKWMLSSDFSSEVKEIVQNALQGQFPALEA